MDHPWPAFLSIQGRPPKQSLERCKDTDRPKAITILRHGSPQRSISVLAAGRVRILVEVPASTYSFVVRDGGVCLC